MFNGFRFPYTDFNKINLDWVMKHLPIECKLTEADNSKAAFVGYTAVLMGEYLLADVHMFAFDTLSANTPLFTLPYNAMESYLTPVMGSNASIFVDSGTNVVYTNMPFSGNITVKCLIKVDRGF